MYLDILKKIEEYQIITLFRHENPDCDAVGSQLGLKTWILDNFKDKKVFALGFGRYDIYPEVDEADDATISNSLAIILDTANAERIDDQRYSKAKEVIKIDHHPDHDPYGNPRFVDPKASSTCQIVTEMLFSFDQYKVSDKCAEYLYSGLLTDTLSFMTSNTSKETFDAASKLLTKNIQPSVISDRVFSINYTQFKSANYVRNNHIYDEGLAYTFIDRATQIEFGLESSDFRNRVSELGGINEFKIWCVFTEEENGTWRGSLRSRGVIINQVAAQFNGGGHPQACGTKLSSKEEVYLLIKSLKSLII